MNQPAVNVLRYAYEQLDTVTMSTDELLANARAATRWIDEAGESSVEIFAESMALRLWSALDERLSSASGFIPGDWLQWPEPHLPIQPWTVVVDENASLPPEKRQGA